MKQNNEFRFWRSADNFMNDVVKIVGMRSGADEFIAGDGGQTAPVSRRVAGAISLTPKLQRGKRAGAV